MSDRQPAEPAPAALTETDRTKRRALLDHAVHDLKNPLAVIRASLEWLEGELHADREEVLDAVRDATGAVGRLLAIIDDLESVARLDGGRELQRESVAIGDIVGHVSASAGARLGRRGVVVSSRAPVVLDATGDAGLLTRALEALVDATARGAPAGACVEVEAVAAGASAIEITVGLRGASAIAAPGAGCGAFGNGSMGVYLAECVVAAHGGVLLVAPTATVPRILVRLPA